MICDKRFKLFCGELSYTSIIFYQITVVIFLKGNSKIFFPLGKKKISQMVICFEKVGLRPLSGRKKNVQ